MAVSGGSTPWLMLRALADEQIPWENVHVVQVDERVAPAGDPERNLTHLRESLLDHAPLPPRPHPRNAGRSADLDSAALQYAQNITGRGGLAAGALTSFISASASTATPRRWCPDDPVLDVADADVAVTGPYQGRRRMTLTFPIINRSRRVLWLVTGAEKAAMLVRLCDGGSVHSGVSACVRIWR